MRFHKVYAGCITAVVIVTAMFLKMEYDMGCYGAVGYCLADLCLEQMKPLMYTVLIVPFLLPAAAYSMRNDFLNSRIMFHRSRMEVIEEQMKRILLISVVFSVVYLAVILGFGMLKKQTVYNWNTERSYFYIRNFECFDGSFAEVLCLIFLICTFRNFVISMVVVLSKWYFKRVVPGFVIILAVCTFELTQIEVHIRLFLRRFTADYPFWITQSMRIEFVASAFMVIGMLFFLGKGIVGKREFFDEKII